MANDDVSRNLKGMDELDFKGWNGADWDGVFAHYHQTMCSSSMASRLPGEFRRTSTP